MYVLLAITTNLEYLKKILLGWIELSVYNLLLDSGSSRLQQQWLSHHQNECDLMAHFE